MHFNIDWSRLISITSFRIREELQDPLEQAAAELRRPLTTKNPYSSFIGLIENSQLLNYIVKVNQFTFNLRAWLR